MNEDRSWERWDDPGVAEAIDRYWVTDPSGYEKVHRLVLSRLVRKYLASPLERVLEVGCGSGLIYGLLVPEAIINCRYVGVDTSQEMLRIARKRFPTGQFIYGDIYSLQFPSDAFDVVLCFKVLGHLPEIRKPIAELLRVAARLVIFTIWPSPEECVLSSTERVCNSQFLHRLYPSNEIVAAIQQAAQGKPFWIETRILSDVSWAYIVYKGQAAQAVQKQENVLPFPGITQEFIRMQMAAMTELERRNQELTVSRETLSETEARLAEYERELVETRTALEVCQTELERTRRELIVSRSKGLSISHELDFFRHRRVTRWLNRFFHRYDARNDISSSFQQLKDDSLIFIPKFGGYLLQPSVNLQRVPFVAYPLDLNRPNLNGILLAPILDLPATKGLFGIELVSPAGQLVAQSTIPVTQIDESVPTRFQFSCVQDSDRGRFWLRVFVRDVDVPVRIWEWRRYTLLGLGTVQTRAFCGFLFESDA